MAKLKIEVADTPSIMAKGLMYRDSLAHDAGMLFKFPMVLEASFWGQNTYIPLDVAFISPEGKITSIKPIVPMSTRAVRSDGSCSMAVETNAGFFSKNGIRVGQKVEFVKDKDGKEIEIVFKTE